MNTNELPPARCRRLHVVFQGVPYVLFTYEELTEVKSRTGQPLRFYAIVRHVVTCGGERHVGGSLQLGQRSGSFGEYVVAVADITTEEFESTFSNRPLN